MIGSNIDFDLPQGLGMMVYGEYHRYYVFRIREGHAKVWTVVETDQNGIITAIKRLCNY